MVLPRGESLKYGTITPDCQCGSKCLGPRLLKDSRVQPLSKLMLLHMLLFNFLPWGRIFPVHGLQMLFHFQTPSMCRVLVFLSIDISRLSYKICSVGSDELLVLSASWFLKGWGALGTNSVISEKGCVFCFLGWKVGELKTSSHPDSAWQTWFMWITLIFIWWQVLVSYKHILFLWGVLFVCWGVSLVWVLFCF